MNTTIKFRIHYLYNNFYSLVFNFFMGYSFKTFLKHTAKDFHNQSVNPPVVRASTIIFKSMQDIRKTQKRNIKDPTGGPHDYGRQGPSTPHTLSKILTNLFSESVLDTKFFP